MTEFTGIIVFLGAWYGEKYALKYHGALFDNKTLVDPPTHP